MLKQNSGKLMLIVIALLLCSAPEAFSQSPTPTPTPRETGKTFTVQIEVSADDSPEKVDRASVDVESKEEGRRFKSQGIHTDRQGVATVSQVPQGKLRIQVMKPGYDTFGEDFTLTEDKAVKITLTKARHPLL